MMLAVIADALQIVVFPLFVAGALSPADDILDFGIAAVLVHLLGWHWEFLPSFFAKQVPRVIRFRSGRLRLQTSIGNRSGSRSPQKRVVSSIRRIRWTSIRIDARRVEAEFRAVPITDVKMVQSVVEKFRERYGVK
jgi:hypothetical protein